MQTKSCACFQSFASHCIAWCFVPFSRIQGSLQSCKGGKFSAGSGAYSSTLRFLFKFKESHSRSMSAKYMIVQQSIQEKGLLCKELGCSMNCPCPAEEVFAEDQ